MQHLILREYMAYFPVFEEMQRGTIHYKDIIPPGEKVLIGLLRRSAVDWPWLFLSAQPAGCHVDDAWEDVHLTFKIGDCGNIAIYAKNVGSATVSDGIHVAWYSPLSDDFRKDYYERNIAPTQIAPTDISSRSKDIHGLPSRRKSVSRNHPRRHARRHRHQASACL